MNNRERKNNKPSVVGIAIIAAVALSQSIAGSVIGAGIMSLVAVLIVIAVIGLVSGLVLGKKKARAKKGSVYHSERSTEAAKRIFMREEMAQNEQAVKCTHPSGKDKYIHQLDGFLANGLIDKNEYRILKDRYDKVVIPENMH